MSKPYLDPDFGAYQQPKPEGAATIFVLGLLGLLICGPLGTIAWIMGNSYLERCRSLRIEPDSLAVAGRIMGILVSVLMGLGLLVMLGILALGIVTSVMSGQGR